MAKIDSMVFVAPDNANGEGTLTIDGVDYKTISIGDQLWMAENLRTTKYNDGQSITLIKDSATWANNTEPAYCWFNNDQSFCESNNYGAYYNWYAVNTDKLCPDGWHVSTDENWQELIDFVGSHCADLGYEGRALKTTSGWEYDESIGEMYGTDTYNFSATPAGMRSAQQFLFNGTFGFWWGTATENAGTSHFIIDGNEDNIRHVSTSEENSSKGTGISVRCVKD